MGLPLWVVNSAQAETPSPTDFFGHALGASRELVSYDEALPYLQLLDESSDYLRLEPIGVTYGGRDLLMAVISTPDNLAQSERYRQISRKLHHPAGLTSEEIAALADSGKTVMLVGLNMHAAEIVSSQTGFEWVYRLVQDPPPGLSDVILLLIPTLNPDGQVMVCDWYRRTRDTPYEGCSMPWLYHTYAGHDINRDWFMLNLEETQAVNRNALSAWFPQVVVDVHQMAQTGPRVFVPPYADPISPRVHPLVHRWSRILGDHMALRLEQTGHPGVIQSYYFDAYWPGGLRSTPWWKNTVGILIESASCRLATPVHIDLGELSGGQKGLPDYTPRSNFPNPWQGGWWTPSHIVEQQITALNAALESSASFRKDLLLDRAAMAKEAMQGSEPPRAFWIPEQQHDPSAAEALVQVLRDNGVQVLETTQESAQGGSLVPAGAVIIPMNQPLRPFLNEVMRFNPYPQVRTTPGQPDVYEPYDVTAWSLPDLLGVEVRLLDDLPRPLKTVGVLPWAEPEVAGDEAEESVWCLEPRHLGNYTLVMALLEQGAEVHQLTAKGEGGEMAGAFVVPGTLDMLREAAGKSSFQASALDWDPRETGAVRRLQLPRIGIYQAWTPSMDEGWTRFMCDRFNVGYATLHNPDIAGGNLQSRFDVIVIPEMDTNELIHGHLARDRQKKDPRPAPYDRGISQKGVDALRRFVNDGGTLITLGAASSFPLSEFDLPAVDISRQYPDLATPGVLLQVDVDTSHPLGFGMPPTASVFHTNSPVFSTQPNSARARAVVCRYPASGDLVRSGWGRGLEAVRLKSALVEIHQGEGKVVLFGFRPQFRGWTRSTYRFVFNAFLDAAAG